MASHSEHRFGEHTGGLWLWEAFGLFACVVAHPHPGPTKLLIGGSCMWSIWFWVWGIWWNFVWNSMQCFLGPQSMARRASESPLLLLPIGWVKKYLSQSGGQRWWDPVFPGLLSGALFSKMSAQLMLIKSFRKAVTQASLRPSSFNSKLHHTQRHDLGP